MTEYSNPFFPEEAFSQEFIKRAQNMMKDYIYEIVEPHHQELLARKREYFESDSGKFAKSVGDFKRRKRMLKAGEGISWQEKEEIGKFYKNCPDGYEVDHIVPVSRGGKHCLSNLRYLTRAENRRKHSN